MLSFLLLSKSHSLVTGDSSLVNFWYLWRITLELHRIIQRPLGQSSDYIRNSLWNVLWSKASSDCWNLACWDAWCLPIQEASRVLRVSPEVKWEIGANQKNPWTRLILLQKQLEESTVSGKAFGRRIETWFRRGISSTFPFKSVNLMLRTWALSQMRPSTDTSPIFA